jgi:hypothetical protein
MAEYVRPSGTVHWIGTGLSTGSGLRVLADIASRVRLWGRTTDKAERCLARLGLADRVAARAFDLASLDADLAPGDVVVSMLPASEHARLLALCVERRAHFACSSYVSEAILANAPAARLAGITVLTEAGLDPGIDHLFADLLVAEGRAAVGDTAATVEFTSYCGGIPAVPNEFRYRFSWAPRAVLSALCSPARYIEAGVEKVAERPWEATRRLVVGGQQFEVYPNRDSLPYVAQYALPASWQPEAFVRGTIRVEGWQHAWAGVFDVLGTGDTDQISTLADDLAVRHPTTGDDRDRVVLAVALRVRGDNGRTWSGEYLLDTIGDRVESAMARCVSVPLACGIADILAEAAPPGLRRAAEGAVHARRWLDFLRRHGIDFRFGDGVEPSTRRDSRSTTTGINA